ncbi:MAG: hypothetical protein KF823_00185 [Xanthomonadales bacterium]|nr:hypothetical protein [Xanthomonadales bacterium]
MSASLALLLVSLNAPLLAAGETAGAPRFALLKEAIGAGSDSVGGSARFRLLATVAEVGASSSASGRFTLTGGFHPTRHGLGQVDVIFCNGFEALACP